MSESTRLAGVMTAMVTPFDRSGALDLGPLDAYLDFQASSGMDGVVVCGTNGEGPSLSIAERQWLLEAVLARRRNLAVVAGTGAAALPDAIELTRHASTAGADAVLVLPPFYFKNPTAAGLASWFRAVLEASDVPVLLYHIPQQSAVPITAELLDLLANRPRLAGIKDSAGKWDATSALIADRPELRIFPGSDELVSRALQGGAAGTITGTANGFPDLVAGVKRAVAAGAGVSEAQARLDAAKSVLLEYPLIAASKSVLARRLGEAARMWVRAPLIDLTPDQEREMFARMNSASVL